MARKNQTPSPHYSNSGSLCNGGSQQRLPLSALKDVSANYSPTVQV